MQTVIWADTEKQEVRSNTAARRNNGNVEIDMSIFDKREKLSAAKPEHLHRNMNFAASEAYKLLRTNLMFLMPDAEKSCPVIGVTSAVRTEGKSTTAVNLAYTLAETGKKVLLIDADMRLPSIGKKLGIGSTPGLSNVLIGAPGENKVGVRQSKVSQNWYILPSGDIPPNPNELLGSHRMQSLLKMLSGSFEYIIIDLPPVNIVSDALVLSPYLDGMLIVVRENFTDKKDLDQCMRQLKLADAKVLGFVMNDTAAKEKRYAKNKKYNSYSD